MPSSHYAILGVPRTFTEDQLKRQYRLLALKYHPDRNRGNEEAAAEKFKEIQAAWSTLSNPEEREAYDAELRDREPVRPPRRRPTAQDTVRPGTSREGGGGYSGYDQRSSGQRGATDGDRGGQRQGQGSQSGFEASWREKQRAAAQREAQRAERRNQCQAAKERAEAAYWREFATDGQWTQPERQPAERQPARAPVPDGMPPGMPPPGESARGPYPRSRATAAQQPARGPQFSSKEFDRFAAASARRAPPADPAPPQAEWDGMEAALAASAAEAAVARLLAERQEAEAQAKAVAEVEESMAREEAEIEEAVRRVEQYMEEEQRFEAQLLAAMTDEQLIAGMTAEEQWAPEPWPAATPRTPMGGSSAGPAAAAPDRTELAERQLAALMEMGYHAAQVASYCDGETPLELLIEQIALGDPASDAPPSGEAREAAEASPPSTPRLSSVRRLGAAAQKVWKAKTSSRPASAREPGRSF